MCIFLQSTTLIYVLFQFANMHFTSHECILRILIEYVCWFCIFRSKTKCILTLYMNIFWQNTNMYFITKSVFDVFWRKTFVDIAYSVTKQKCIICILTNYNCMYFTEMYSKYFDLPTLETKHNCIFTLAHSVFYVV